MTKLLLEQKEENTSSNLDLDKHGSSWRIISSEVCYDTWTGILT